MNEKPTMSSNEHTPLVAVVQVAPPRERYPHRNLRRVCTALLATVPVFVFGVLLLALIAPFPLPWIPDDNDGDTSSLRSLKWTAVPNQAWPQSEGVSFEELKEILLKTPDPKKAREWSKYYTAGPHLAGKNLSQAVWTKDKWEEFGVASSIVAYDTYINYPKGHRLALLEESRGKTKVTYEASLEEDILKEDPTSGLPDRIPTFHGYSASGNVTAPYVYVNYGTYQDFEDLVKANVSLKGKIALVKYGGVFRGLKVKRAQALGMVGAVIYSDPGDDGDVTEKNGYKPYPEGPARQPSSVQRGSVQYLSVAPGDPTTPGYPSKPGVPRQPVNGSIPDIPSIPISYTDALPLLKALNGHGPKASDFNKYWQGGGLDYKGVKYNIGPTPDNVTLNLVNEQEYVTTPLWNVIGIINGTIPDEVVVLGNHRDAWIAGGAGDPNSGSAVMVEVVRSFGEALAKGWKPLRTIVFASWDGEEYGLIGSTEWVEEYLPWLSKATVAYLNVDVGAAGTHFEASAAPLLNKALIEVTQMVQSPNQTVKGQTVGDVWNGHIRTMGSGSDFTAFQDFAGIPCVDMGFSYSTKDAVYHYHSNYDSFYWMDTYGDKGFEYHGAMVKLWSLLAAKIVETPIIVLNATDYADGLMKYLDSVKALATKTAENTEVAFTAPKFKNLTESIQALRNASIAFDAKADELAEKLAHSDIPWWKWWEKVKIYYQVRQINDRYKYLERQFLYAPGLDGRNWFKHVVFAPGLWTGYAGATYPGLVESIEARNKEGIEKWEGIIEGIIRNATKSLS